MSIGSEPSSAPVPSSSPATRDGSTLVGVPARHGAPHHEGLGTGPGRTGDHVARSVADHRRRGLPDRARRRRSAAPARHAQRRRHPARLAARHGPRRTRSRPRCTRNRRAPAPTKTRRQSSPTCAGWASTRSRWSTRRASWSGWRSSTIFSRRPHARTGSSSWPAAWARRLHELTQRHAEADAQGRRPAAARNDRAQLRRSGLPRFYFAVNYTRRADRAHFGDGNALGVEIHYLREEQRLGTAGALSLLPARRNSRSW